VDAGDGSTALHTPPTELSNAGNSKKACRYLLVQFVLWQLTSSESVRFCQSMKLFAVLLCLRLTCNDGKVGLLLHHLS